MAAQGVWYNFSGRTRTALLFRDSHFPQVLLARQSVHSNQIYVKLNQIGATRALPIQCFDQIETRKSQQVIYCHCHHIISIVMGAHFGPLRVLVAFSNARRVTNIDFLFAETPLRWCSWWFDPIEEPKRVTRRNNNEKKSAVYTARRMHRIVPIQNSSAIFWWYLVIYLRINWLWKKSKWQRERERNELKISLCFFYFFLLKCSE